MYLGSEEPKVLKSQKSILEDLHWEDHLPQKYEQQLQNEL